MEIQIVRASEHAEWGILDPPSQTRDGYVHKFVVLDGKLIIGNVDRHHTLISLATGVDLAAVKKDPNLRSRLSAAGSVRADGTVRLWRSSGFEFATPLELRSELQAVIRDLLTREKIE